MSISAFSVSSAGGISRATVALFPIVQISAVTVSTFSAAVLLFDSETAVSVFCVSGVS
jgi:hypothetical protein